MVGEEKNIWNILLTISTLSPTIAPKPEVLEPAQFRELGAQRLKFRYGPLLVPGVHDPDTMGMKEFVAFIQPPCTDCYITHYQAGLEFEDGSNANAHTGMWLHHTVLLDFSQQDPICEEQPLRLFASGNERTPIDLSINGYVLDIPRFLARGLSSLVPSLLFLRAKSRRRWKSHSSFVEREREGEWGERRK